MRALLLLIVTLVACDPFAPHENPSRTVEGCAEAVAHLRSCCPAWNSYVSCTYFTNAVPSPDLTSSQSKCVAKTPCAEIAHAVEHNDRVCGFLAETTQCH